MRTCGNASIVRGDGALGLEFGNLSIERRRNFLLRNRARACGAVARYRFCTTFDGLHHTATRACVLRGQSHLTKCFIEKKCRRYHSRFARCLDASKLAIELLAV